MPCYRPIDVPILRKSIYSKWRQSEIRTVPCGSCIGCRSEQSRQWAVRMLHESREHDHNNFVTLTLKDEELNHNNELVPKDFTRFIKDLRKTQERRLSYYGCGEYGEQTARPHYHALLFGYEFTDRDFGFDNSRPGVWRSKTLDDTWGRGKCEGGAVTMASASYVSGYIRKKVKAARYQRANPLTGELIAPEFARMSLRPAIGKHWIKKWWRDVYPKDYVVIDGVEAKPPRYYDKFMDYTDDQGGTKERRAIMQHVRDARYAEAVEMSKYQLMSGEKIARARANLFARRDAV